MRPHTDSPHVAVIGAGISGAACARGLVAGGCRVTLFDKSRGVGGRLATRRARVVDADGRPVVEAAFDHGAPGFRAQSGRFAAMLARAEADGAVRRAQPRVYSDRVRPAYGEVFTAVPAMPALVKHELEGLPVHLGHAVLALSRRGDAWHVEREGQPDAGPFDAVVLAMPPRQAAALLKPHETDWAQRLGATRMSACWALMAVTDDVPWPWDAAELSRGALSWIARADRAPGRERVPGHAHWVAHASAAWSAAHLEETPAAVAEALGAELQKWLPGERADGEPVAWLHVQAHRWRFAHPLEEGRGPWWDAALGLGVCGDALGVRAPTASSVEAAWRSGDELADQMAFDLAQTATAYDPVPA